MVFHSYHYGFHLLFCLIILTSLFLLLNESAMIAIKFRFAFVVTKLMLDPTFLSAKGLLGKENLNWEWKQETRNPLSKAGMSVKAPVEAGDKCDGVTVELVL